jgi:H/ACA ribonucleoprotein complex non-core subunit NAF1
MEAPTSPSADAQGVQEQLNNTATVAVEKVDTPPPITHALEALLGGLDDPAGNDQAEDVQMNNAPKPEETLEPQDALNIENNIHSEAASKLEDAPTAEAAPGSEQVPEQVGLILEEAPKGDHASSQDNALEGDNTIYENAATANLQVEDVQMEDVTKSEVLQPETAPKPESIPDPITASTLGDAANAEDALRAGSAPKPENAQEQNDTVFEDAPAEEEHPEWEIDSSPIESSSDDSSSDDSTSEDSDEEDENSYKLLSPEEQARILMEGDGGSDDEGGNKGAKGSGGQLRTKNEVPEEVIPKPDVTITQDMKIEELGAVEAIVENILLIKAKISGEYRVLESGSVLCLGDRSVIGVVSETLGRVQQPLYSVRFTNAGEITEAGLAAGTTVFYSEQHSTYVFTQALKAFKGSDASNLHDEEVGDEEIEFSDDEAEMEHKRRLKQRRIEKRGGKMQQNGDSNRGGHPLQQQHAPSDQNGGLNYDDAEDDGPYKPLVRPTGYASTVGRSEAPQEGGYAGGQGDRNGQSRGRGRGDRGRGRGDRGGGGDRGRGRGGYQDRRGDNNGYSLPPQNQPTGQYPMGRNGPPLQSLGGHFSQPPLQSPQGPGFQQPPQFPPPNFYGQQQGEHSPHQPQIWPQFPPLPPYQQFPNMQNGWPNAPPPFPLPSGAFINPAFFRNAGNTQGQNGGPGNPNNKR